MIGRIDQQAWGAGAQRQYKTVLVATEIVLVSFAVPEEAPVEASLADVSADAEQAAATEPSVPEPAVEPKPRRRRTKRAA